MSIHSARGSARQGCRLLVAALMLITLAAVEAAAQTNNARLLSGAVVTRNNESVQGVLVTVRSASGAQQVVTDQAGAFQVTVPNGPLTVHITGDHVAPRERFIGVDDPTEDVLIETELIVPRLSDSVVVKTSLDPTIDRRDDAVYKNALFSRDDQIFYLLDAGINAGQHEGGGKSVEIRRFGSNLDHGGVGGGLKVLVDDIQQNQGTQGHGQGYLGQLKTLTPELVEGVDILNGPFSAEYGDFSGLGVVHIRLNRSLPDLFMFRFQGGSFDSTRAFLAYSPQMERMEAFIAFERSTTNGPFINPSRYTRNNLTGNYTRHLSETRSLGFKLNAGTNTFFSSGQLPLDEVEAGRVSRFGLIDPDEGGDAQTATLGTYYRNEQDSGASLKVDGFVSRSLLDLYSNFTFFLHDEVNGDEIQQHDSRLQEGLNLN
ncbi:MAG TPA: carboxypeptidase-like regulatory domain-containing protein, partial [Blastocatellia bacterium]|nr:carboxypeptidase-like regulatory domain-containing protein [Blastocatellia bacterium]